MEERYKMSLEAIANMIIPSDNSKRVDSIMSNIAVQSLRLQNNSK